MLTHRVGSAGGNREARVGELMGRLKPARRRADRVCLEGIAAD